jgi:hypothetical protein
MRKCLVLVALLAGVTLAARLELVRAGEKNEPKYKTKEVMKLAHKDGLLKKVLEGDASKEDKQMLLDLYVALSLNPPKKGEADSWKMKTAALVDCAKSVVANSDGGIDKLKKAADCKGCHSVHK